MIFDSIFNNLNYTVSLMGSIVAEAQKLTGPPRLVQAQ